MVAKLRLNRTDGSIILIIATLVLQLAFFSPLQVLVLNFGEFSIRFISALLLYLVLAVSLIFVIWMSVRLLKIPILPALLTFASTVAFLESRFFLSMARHHPFDGKLIDWQSLQWLSYVELAAISVAGILFVIFYKRIRFLTTASLFILFFVTSGFLFTLFWNTDVVLDKRHIETTESQYFNEFSYLSSQRNVIHIVPDQAQGAMLQDIIDNDFEYYSKMFDGFTLFTQAMGQYKGTYPSVLYYMSGEGPNPENDLTLKQPFSRQYIADTLEQRSIVTRLSDNGFKTFGFQFHPGIFCKGPYTACTGTHDEVFAGAPVNSYERRFKSTVLTMMDVALFQSTPIVLRQKIYDDGRWFARRYTGNAVSHSSVLDTFIEKMRVGGAADTYNYFHHAGAHAPILFDRDCNHTGLREVNRESQQEQVRCTLKQLEKMILRLKDIGAYDQTMIVIHGDHGTPWLPPGFEAQFGWLVPEDKIGMASAMMLIKPRDSRGVLAYSDAAVTIGDVPATIASGLGISHDYSGLDMLAGEVSVKRERYYFDYEDSARAHNMQALPNLTRYRVFGNVYDERDWVLPNASVGGDSFSRLRMDDPDFSLYAHGFSDLEQHSVPMRWVDGKQAQVLLEPPGQDAIALVFECYVPPFIAGQSIEIRVEGRLVATLDEKALVIKRHIIPLPEDISQLELLNIEFNMGVSVQQGNDLRQLSALFAYVGLEPSG